MLLVFWPLVSLTPTLLRQRSETHRQPLSRYSGHLRDTPRRLGGPFRSNCSFAASLSSLKYFGNSAVSFRSNSSLYSEAFSFSSSFASFSGSRIASTLDAHEARGHLKNTAHLAGLQRVKRLDDYLVILVLQVPTHRLGPSTTRRRDSDPLAGTRCDRNPRRSCGPLPTV